MQYKIVDGSGKEYNSVFDSRHNEYIEAWALINGVPTKVWAKGTAWKPLQNLPNNTANVIYGDGKFVSIASQASTYNVVFAYCDDKTEWKLGTLTRVYPEYALGPFHGAYGNGVYVVLGSAYRETHVFKSNDGINWTEITRTLSSAINNVRYVNDRFIATGTSGYPMESSDGETWTYMYDVSSVKDAIYFKGEYILIGTRNYIYKSSDFVTWTRYTTDKSFMYMYSIATLENIIVMESSGDLFYSTDCIAWQEGQSLGYIYSVVSGQNELMCMNSTTTYKSTDGITWNEIATPNPFNCMALAYGDGNYVAVGTTKNSFIY